MKQDVVFKFTFNAPAEGCNLSVLSRDYFEMSQFLKQHGFDNITDDDIEIIPIDEMEGYYEEDCNYICPYKFKSNTSDDIITLYTTEQLVNEALNDVSSDLAETLLFGNAITEDGFEIIKVINELMYNFKHVDILEHTLADSEEDDYNDRYRKSFSLSTKLNSIVYNAEYDDSYIYDSIFTSSSQTKIQPITIEGYVRCFAYLISGEHV